MSLNLNRDAKLMMSQAPELLEALARISFRAGVEHGAGGHCALHSKVVQTETAEVIFSCKQTKHTVKSEKRGRHRQRDTDRLTQKLTTVFGCSDAHRACTSQS